MEKKLAKLSIAVLLIVIILFDLLCPPLRGLLTSMILFFVWVVWLVTVFDKKE